MLISDNWRVVKIVSRFVTYLLLLTSDKTGGGKSRDQNLIGYSATFRRRCRRRTFELLSVHLNQPR